MKALLIAATLLAAGTAHASDAKSATDDFDGATRVWVDPHGMSCGWTDLCYSVGAEWNSKRPDVAILVVEFMGAYTPVKAAAFNIDGELVPLAPPHGQTAFGQGIAFTPGTYNPALAAGGRTSTQGFDIPLPVLQRVLSAKVVKMRIIIAEGNVDARMIDSEEASKAYRALQRFWEKLPYHPAPTAPAASTTDQPAPAPPCVACERIGRP